MPSPKIYLEMSAESFKLGASQDQYGAGKLDLSSHKLCLDMKGA